MCEWGTSEDVKVTIQAHLSHTGKTRKRIFGIDKCIAPIIRALENAGIHMLASCCGHGKTNGRIDLVDGRVLIMAELERCPECGSLGSIDDDQRAGKVSIRCSECGHHYFKETIK